MHRVIRSLALSGFAALLGVAFVHAQAIQVSERTVVARSSDYPFFEPHLTVHPSNPKHLLAAAFIGRVSFSPQEFQQNVRRWTCASFLSLDGGTTWERHDFPVTGCVDPWVAITPDGQAVFTAIGAHAALAQQGSVGLIVFHSANGGRTWDEKPLGLGPSHDHSTVAVDLSSPARKGWLYVLSTQGISADDSKRRPSVFVARSRDGGRSFEEPARIIPNNLDNHPEMAVVLSNGTLVLSFVDAGWNVSAVSKASGAFDRRRAWVIRSNDGGHSFSIPLFANDACGPPPGFQLSALAADQSSGRFRDRLYFACRQKDGGPIVVNYSTDGGETWSDPLPAHRGPVDVKMRRIAGVAVNNRGVLGVAWIEGRGEAGERCQEVSFAASLDGGLTFLPEQRVASLTCQPSATDTAIYRRWPTGGDYFGLVAMPDGQFRLMWAEARRGTPELWTALVKIADDIVETR